MNYVVPAIYLIGVVVLYYPIVHTLAHTLAGSDRDGTDWGFAVVIGAILAAFWPVILAGFCVFLVSTRIWTGTWARPWSTPTRDRSNVR